MAIIKTQRNSIPEQDPIERAKNFDEVSTGFTAQMAMDEAARCLNCKNAACMKGCPVGVKIPEFLALVRDGKFREAGEVVKSTNFLPSICGRVCPQEEQCEKACIRTKIDFQKRMLNSM